MKISTLQMIAVFCCLIVSFIVVFSIQALHMNLSASVYSPWWSSQDCAKAKVTWGHPQWIGDGFVVHNHTADFSLHARIGTNNPKQLNGLIGVSSLQGTVSKFKQIEDRGEMRWQNDGYASASIA